MAYTKKRPQSTEKMEQIERMLELDLFEPSKSPYYSHVHLVRKSTWYMAVLHDFHTINDLCCNIALPIPNIAQEAESIHKV
jgi:hypothetical protein